eukprot:TRINITY_DN5309_c0_g1_i1.p1 TRINITY_DN5309_c0_g1~~TRINITY_DN5309_c0_g1_i1.p1  ORF type:complete len:728 (+),score=187.22 TRINITY_DN5309_c0_g1_i1:465-2648(+)
MQRLVYGYQQLSKQTRTHNRARRQRDYSVSTDNIFMKSHPRDIPLYNQIEPTHIEPCTKEILEEATALLDRIESDSNLRENPTWDNVMEPIIYIEKLVGQQLWGPINHLMHVKNSDALRQAVGNVTDDVTKFSVRMEQSAAVYEALVQLKEREWDNLDYVQKRIIDKKILSAKLSGVSLDDAKKGEYSSIAQKLVNLSKDFTDNTMDTIKNYEMVLNSKEEVSGLPKSLLSLASHSYNEKNSTKDSTPENGPWRITLDAPSLVPFLEHADRRDLREKLYFDYIRSGGEENTEITYKILELRQQKAKLLGFSDYTEVSLATKMAESKEEVLDLLEQLRSNSWDSAQEEYKELREYAKAKSGIDDLKQWDVSYFSNKLKEEKYGYSNEELRYYFQMPIVMEGLFNLVEELFSVRVKECPESEYKDLPLWNESCKFFYIYPENGDEPIAAFFLDPYVRPADKRGGAWMDTSVYKSKKEGKDIIPIAHIVCNGTPPLEGQPSLLTFRDVETLFHEFGHALQHMLAKSPYPDGGINGVEWDAVELPSQFMENWCYHKPTLMGITKHVETGEPLSDELFEKICASKNFMSGSAMLRQLMFGTLDMKLHSTYDPAGKEQFSIFDLQKEVMKTTSVLPMLQDDKFLCRFTHIFAGGYAAGYYSYKWAEVMSADAFGAFEEAGLDNTDKVKELGLRFRDTILGEAGSKHAAEVFQEFRGRKPSPEALLRHSNLLKN